MTNQEIRLKYETKTETKYPEVFSREDTDVFMNKARADERERVINEIEGIYDNFARDLRDITVKYLKIGATLNYENETDKLIKQYNSKLNSLKGDGKCTNLK